MLKKITEPQALYTKQGLSAAGGSTFSTKSNMGEENRAPRSKSSSQKIMGGVLALILFVAVGVAGVMTAMRQQQVAGPVAPNAPSSVPLAAGLDCGFCGTQCVSGVSTRACPRISPPSNMECLPDTPNNRCMPVPTANSDVCALPFTVTTATPPPNKVPPECLSKTAYRVDAQNKEVAIADNGSILPGTEFNYKITVRATGPSFGTVSVKDTLPKGVEFVAVATSTTPAPTKTTDGNENTVLTFSLGAMGATATQASPQIRELAIKVKTDTAIDPGALTNAAQVIDTGLPSTTAPSACYHTVVIPPNGVAACIAKEMHTASYTDTATNTLISDGSALEQGREFYYRVKLASTQTTAGDVTVTDTLPAGVEVVNAGDFAEENGKYIARFTAFSGEKTAEMKVRVKSGIQGSVVNAVAVTTANTTADAALCEATFAVPTNGCNTACQTDAQCTAINTDYRCVSTSIGNRCRLNSNQGSTSCQVASTATPTPTPTPTPGTTPPPVSTVGCNYTCATNADCTNAAHICYQTASGGRCRLDANVTSESCSMPVVEQPAQPGQPVLPEELPQTGPEDWANWLKAGLVTLGIGAILLLLL